MHICTETKREKFCNRYLGRYVYAVLRRNANFFNINQCTNVPVQGEKEKELVDAAVTALFGLDIFALRALDNVTRALYAHSDAAYIINYSSFMQMKSCCSCH